jgi:hypothetical protein
MTSFPENEALTLWTGLALFLLIESLFFIRIIRTHWEGAGWRNDPSGPPKD